MTRDYLLSKTLYGVDIFQHIIRKEYPDHIMHIKGDFIGECPDPVHPDGGIIDIQVEKTYIEGRRLPDRKAKFHSLDGSLPDGDAIDLATAYYKAKGETLTEQEIIDRIAAEMYIHEKGYSPYAPKFNTRKSDEVTGDKIVPATSPALPPCPKFSFYRRPIKNTQPCREASPQDIYKYLISDYAKKNTAHLRSLTDPKQRRRFKAENFDYITPGGIFRSRKESDIVEASGYICIDYDHVPDPAALLLKLINDDNFETILAFRSPSGDGVKWIVARPNNMTRRDGTPFTHGDFFTVLSNYSRKVFGVEADPSGKDICRACFLPHDPDAFLNPFYIEDNFDYDITRFLQ